MEIKSADGNNMSEGINEPQPATQTCEAAEKVKRLLGSVQTELVSDIGIYALNDSNEREPLVDLMLDSVERFLDDSYMKLQRLEGRNQCRRLDPIICQECGCDCLSHTILDLHISEMHDPFFVASPSRSPTYNCPVPWCFEKLPCPDSRRLHACLAHGLLANSPIFSVLKQT